MITGTEVQSTKETIHGLMRLAGDEFVVQWRVSRETDRVGAEIRTDREMEEVREVRLPLDAIAEVSVRRRWWSWLTGPSLVLTATDLRAFDALTGEHGLQLDHPARLVLRLPRAAALEAGEFAADLSLALAELPAARRLDRLTDASH